jgi:DNA polymerase III subunit epsilon
LDAQLLAQVYVELTGGRQIGLGLVAELVGHDIAQAIDPAATGFAPVNAIMRPARPHAASAEELARHAAFLAGIKDPIWNRL